MTRVSESTVTQQSGNRAASVAGGLSTELAEVQVAFDRMKTAQRNHPYPPSYAERISRIDRLISMSRRYQDDLVSAARADFGSRSPHETILADVFATVSVCKYIRGNLKKWMAPDRRHIGMTLAPARAAVQSQPLGVVGIIAPWNYPYYLAVSPLAFALAAGNRALVKPSELTPNVSELMANIMDEAFAPDVVDVMTGGPDVATFFSSLPFDHILFTGSTKVGGYVMQAAAKNLTPVTLELGGKSPTIVHRDYPIEKAVDRIVAGKYMNCGQTCIAPDYVMVHESEREAFVTAFRESIARSYPSIAGNQDYTSIVSDRHYERVQGLIRDAEKRGATKIEVNPAGETFEASDRKIPPTLLLDVNDDMDVMREEIFGPVLPVRTYQTLDEAIDYVNDHPRPLALYYFDQDAYRAEDVLARTTSGGAAINDTVLHVLVDDMPFGGVGPSGIGAYHGKEGFETFSHKKAVFYQSRVNGASLLAPPYGKLIETLSKLLIGK